MNEEESSVGFKAREMPNYKFFEPKKPEKQGPDTKSKRSYRTNKNGYMHKKNRNCYRFVNQLTLFLFSCLDVPDKKVLNFPVVDRKLQQEKWGEVRRWCACCWMVSGGAKYYYISSVNSNLSIY